MSESLLIGSWNFKSDQVHQYAFLHNFLSKEECKKVIKKGKELKLKKATTNGGIERPIRKSNVSWIYPSKDMEWLFRRATDSLTPLNNKYFNFNITGLHEGFQFTKYKPPGGKYGRHTDRCFNIEIRKLSISIQLTDPKKYEGGDLKLYNGGEEDASLMDKSQGTLIIFPSFIMHEVMPVTKGHRNSLVTWVTGPSFK
jgi:PKHD-type hydroxylase